MSGASVAEPTPPIDDAAGPACEKCGFVTDAAACPQCGWYPSLGIHVEVDQQFEAVTMRSGAPPEADAPTEKKGGSELEKHLAVWRDLIPAWGWLLLGTAGGIVIAAIVARIATLDAPQAQTLIGVSGLIGGLVTALFAHITAFVLCSADDAEFGVTDVVIKPFKTWKQLATELPDRLWLANTGNAGVTAALSAALIVGGVPYDRLLDWGFKARAQKNLVATIAQEAAKNGGGEDQSMEDAMAAFADQAGVDDLEPTPKAKPRIKLECVILGYQADKEGRLKTVLLAAERYGKLKYVGQVRPQLDKKEAAALLQSFERNHSSRPLVKTGASGVWLRPRFFCRVTYTDWPDGKRPKELAWDALLEEMKTPW